MSIRTQIGNNSPNGSTNNKYTDYSKRANMSFNSILTYQPQLRLLVLVSADLWSNNAHKHWLATISISIPY